MYWNCGNSQIGIDGTDYIMADDNCWDPWKNEWFICEERLCQMHPEWFGGECDFGRDRRGGGRRIEKAKDWIEDWAEDFSRSQEDGVRNITDSAEGILDNLRQNITAMFNETIANVTAELQNATDTLTNETTAWTEENLTEEAMHKLMDDARDELDLGLLIEAEPEEGNSATLGLVAAGVAATAAGLFVARLKCRKDDEAFERV